MATQTFIHPGAIILNTRIPEHRVEGLEYGAHVTGRGWSGYYVRPVGDERWGVARETPASDETYESDNEIVAAIRTELLRGTPEP